MALQLNSPAMGMGNPLNDVTTDQRGMPLDPDSPGSPDIGAFQTQPAWWSIRRSTAPMRRET